jgi:hypothetical protein
VKDDKPTGESKVLFQATHFDDSVVLKEALDSRLDLLNAHRELALQKIQALLGKQPLPDQGSIFVGTKGAMLLPHIALPSLYPAEQFKDFKLPRDPGTSHNKQFIDAVLGTAKTSAPFDYSGPLTEAALLGNVAYRCRCKIEWDSAKLRAKNCPAADEFIHHHYRRGWKI